MKNEFPKHFKRIMQGIPEHSDIFANVYRTNRWGKGSGGGSRLAVTKEYHEFLDKFFKENKVKSVVDLGCGYWESNEQSNWKGKKYHGIDCVETVIKDNIEKQKKFKTRKFSVGDIKTCDIPKCDVLLIKDVFIHWKNAEIIAFLKRDLPVRYILTTNDDHGDHVNRDINIPGMYHSIDLSKEPFNIEGEEVFLWTKQNKTTFLIKR